jgi:undecaprenyl diphosphate synthase
MTKEKIAELLSEIKKGEIPEHVAVIMDGNGRWAKKYSMPRVWGHQKGVESVKSVVEGCLQTGVKTLTLYAFSEENWGRPKEEVSTIMSLIDTYIVKERETMLKNQIRLRAIGCLDKLSTKTQALISETEEYLKNQDKLLVNIALSYGSRTEIIHACKKIAQKIKDGLLEVQDITPDLISQNLWTEGLKDPDLFIRTSGEQRLSNFLLWQLSYTELWFTSVLWPDFRKQHFFEGIAAYQSRKRRYGLIT